MFGIVEHRLPSSPNAASRNIINSKTTFVTQVCFKIEWVLPWTILHFAPSFMKIELVIFAQSCLQSAPKT